LRRSDQGEQEFHSKLKWKLTLSTFLAKKPETCKHISSEFLKLGFKFLFYVFIVFAIVNALHDMIPFLTICVTILLLFCFWVEFCLGLQF